MTIIRSYIHMQLYVNLHASQLDHEDEVQLQEMKAGQMS